MLLFPPELLFDAVVPKLMLLLFPELKFPLRKKVLEVVFVPFIGVLRN